MTEVWERFSYYGMRALLVLYMNEVRGSVGLIPMITTVAPCPQLIVVLAAIFGFFPSSSPGALPAAQLGGRVWNRAYHRLVWRPG